MAIQLNDLKTEDEVTHAKAYAIIVKYTVDKLNSTIEYIVNTYHSKATRDKRARFVKQQTYQVADMVASDTNQNAELYGDLKLKNIFKDGTDV